MDDPILIVSRWLEQAVLGLGLCPFARRPWEDGSVRLIVSVAADEEALLHELHAELVALARTPAAQLETTLLIVPELLRDFDDYNQCLDLVDGLLEAFGWVGRFQVASFHPDYCFADTEPDSRDNLTNRAPYPILHLLREASITAALENVVDPEQIHQRNIATMRALDAAELNRIFPYLRSAAKD